MKKLHKKQIKIELYDITINLYYGTDIKKLLKSFKKDYPKYQKNYNINLKDYYDSEGLCIPMGSSFAILITKLEKNIPQMQLIAHECTHCAIGIFNTISTTIDPYNQEPFTYLVDHLVGETIRFIEES